MSHFFIFAPVFVIAFCCANARAQTVDTLKHLPSKTIEITALRPSDLPTIEARQAVIKPTDAIYRQTGSMIAGDVLKAISSSLDVRQYGSLGSAALPSFRGLPAEYTIIYRDGIRVTNEQLGETDLGQLTLHGISHVELIPSSSAILLGGDAIGAAINLVSAVQDSNHITIGSEQTNYSGASGFPTQSYYTAVSLKPMQSLSIVAGGSLDQSTGAFPFFQDSAHPNVLRENNDAAIRSANLAALWTPSDNTSIRFLGNYFYANRGAGGATTTPGQGASSLSARQSDAQTFGAIKADHDDGPIASTFAVCWQRQFESYRDPIQGTNDSAWNTLLNSAARGSYTINPSIEAFAGLETEHSSLAGKTNKTPSGDSIIGRERTNGYLAAKYFPLENLDVNGSLRVENISGLSLTEFLPQAAIDYSPIQDLSIEGAYSRSFHAPTLNDLYWYQGGNSKLEPEHGENWQTSVTYEPEWNWISPNFSATGFLAQINNEILWLPSVGNVWTPVNVEEVESKGIEFRANAKIILDAKTSLQVDESYTLLLARNITSGDVNYGKEIAYSSPSSSLFIAEIERNDLGSLALLFRYCGHKYSDPGNTEDGKLPPVTTCDITITSREFTFENVGLKMMLNVANLTDQHYEEVINYPLPGRTYSFSIELNYH